MNPFSFNEIWLSRKESAKDFDNRNETLFESLEYFFRDPKNNEYLKYLAHDSEHEDANKFMKMMKMLTGSWKQGNRICADKNGARTGCSPMLACLLEMLRDTSVFSTSECTRLLDLFSTPTSTFPQRDNHTVTYYLHRFHTFDWIHHYILVPLDTMRSLYQGKVLVERLVIALLRQGKKGDDIGPQTIFGIKSLQCSGNLSGTDTAISIQMAPSIQSKTPNWLLKEKKHLAPHW